MSEQNKTPRDAGTPGGNLGEADGVPETGSSLDNGRVQFAPQETEAIGPHSGPGPTDDEIRSHVCTLMNDEGWVDASGIEVYVREAEVTLEGTVESEEARRLAENIALAVSTVRAVHNRLQVRAAKETGLLPQD